jgi:hypothetical protein
VARCPRAPVAVVQHQPQRWSPLRAGMAAIALGESASAFRRSVVALADFTLSWKAWSDTNSSSPIATINRTSRRWSYPGIPWSATRHRMPRAGPEKAAGAFCVGSERAPRPPAIRD